VEDRRGETIALNGVGRVCRAAGRFEEALVWHTAALELARRIHAAGEEVDVLYDLARSEQGLGRTAQAAAYFEASLSISMRIGAPAEEARAMRALTELRGMLGESVVPEQ
jgi:tetratricopeptide (TPR) repeat protein